VNDMDLNIKDFPDDLIGKLDKLAEKQGRSRSKQIIIMLQEAIK